MNEKVRDALRKMEERVNDQIENGDDGSVREWTHRILPELSDDQVQDLVLSLANGACHLHPSLRDAGPEPVFFIILSTLELGRELGPIPEVVDA